MEEGIQETLQGIGGNAIAKTIHDKEGKLLDGIAEQGGAAGIVSFFASAVASAAEGASSRRRR